jgi:hypothetical protein
VESLKIIVNKIKPPQSPSTRLKKKSTLWFKSLLAIFLFLGSSCASKKLLKYEKIESFQMNEEYEKMVKVEKTQEESSNSGKSLKTPPKLVETSKKSEELNKTAKTHQATLHMEKTPPAKYNDKTVDSGKPIKAEFKNVKPSLKSKSAQRSHAEKLIETTKLSEASPFEIGEEIELAVTYFNMAAGYLKLKVLPFAQVNGRKSYDFAIELGSSKVFSYFYSVEDKAQTFVDFETLNPTTFTIDVKESVQLKDIRSFFDFKNNKGTYWEKKISKGKKEENKKVEWDIFPNSQNVISAIFFLRNLNLEVGKEVAFRVGDAGKNLIFKGHVLRQETIKTEIGEFDTLVIQPKFEIDGAFKPVGDIFIWLTNDHRKFPVKIDAKIKIGTLILKLKSLKK